MGFGNMLKSAVEVTESSSQSSRSMTSVFLDLKQGSRTFRFLPSLEDKNEPMPGEVVFSIWLPVKVGETMAERRFFIDDRGRSIIDSDDNQKGRMEKTRLGSRVKLRFFMNVYDRTRVMKMADNVIIYPNAQNQYYTKDGKQITDTKPKPNGQIMVLEGSVSTRAGSTRGLLNELDGLAKTLYDVDDEGNTVLLPITGVDIVMTTTGTGFDTSRKVHPGSNREPLPQDVLELPLYDLKSFTKPIDTNALRQLLDGRDYVEVVKEFNIPTSPKLQEAFLF